MSFHINAKTEDIASSVLLPGDPLRAKYIAEKFLQDSFCYNEVRGMYGYTGYYHGKRVSVQGTGMGVPSISIYAHELLKEYSAKKLIRIGTCGACIPKVKIKDVILAVSASSNASLNSVLFNNDHYAPTADFELLLEAYKSAQSKNMKIHAGNVLTSDFFYLEDKPEYMDKWANYGELAAEMETAALYTLAARFNAAALAILTVSDSRFEDGEISSIDKEKNLNQMIEIALELV